MSDIIVIRGTRYVICECITCGVVYSIPETVYDHHRQEGGYHTCSNGHSQGWSKDKCERERLRRERDNLKQQTARLEDEKRAAEAFAAEQTARALKAERAEKRLKKRASAGTCPCCQRTFANMSEHMKRQHPEFMLDGGTNIVPIKART